MQLVTEDAHRALAYVAALNRRGASPTVQQFEQYAKQPDRRLGRQQAMDEIIASLRDEVFNPLRVVEPEESPVRYCRRMGWIDVSNEEVTITKLGGALLAELESPSFDENAVLEVLVDPEDGFAYERVLGSLAAMGRGMLIDPYLQSDQLYDVVGSTEIDRILISPKIRDSEMKRIAFTLGAVPTDRPLELRVTAPLHDRYVVPSSGAVKFVGCGLNGIGKALSVVGELGPAASDAIRESHEHLWDKAEVLRPVKRGVTKP